MSELDLVSPEVRELFERPNAAWQLGTPAVIQLSRDVQQLNLLLRELTGAMRDQNGALQGIYDLLWEQRYGHR